MTNRGPVLGNAKDRNDSIYSNDDNYKWDNSSPDSKNHRWRRTKGHNGAKAIAIIELRKRDAKIKKNYDSVQWVAQNSYYYFLRKIFLKHGINPDAEGRDFRKSITKEIAGWCEEIGTTREDLKIYASSRAYLYFRGKRTAVSLKSIEQLALDGTDIIIIEKQDIAEIIHPYTDAAGIAILDTKGFLVLYARKLSKLAKRDGCNIAMITDLDDAGIFMTVKVKDEIPSLFRIGVNFKMLQDLNIDADMAAESYSGSTMKVLDNIDVDNDIATAEELEFMRTRRVEIDSVIQEVNDNERFSKYVIKMLVEKFKTRDYNRAIVVKDYAFSSPFWDLQELLKNRSKPILTDKVEEIRLDLQEYEGVIDNVEDEENHIAAQLGSHLDIITSRRRRYEHEQQAGGPQEQLEDYIRLVDRIQDLVDEENGRRK